MALSVTSSVGEILDRVASRIEADAYWAKRLEELRKQACEGRSVTAHLAVFVEPYLGFVLNGTKTVESRFSINKCAPFKQAGLGDLLLIKQSGGGVVAICEIGSVAYYDLDSAAFAFIRERFSTQLAITDEAFWRTKRRSSYASLLRISHVCSISPLEFKKRDRRGWVVFRTPQNIQSTRSSQIPAGSHQSR